jgi:hypothetical protein
VSILAFETAVRAVSDPEKNADSAINIKMSKRGPKTDQSIAVKKSIVDIAFCVLKIYCHVIIKTEERKNT